MKLITVKYFISSVISSFRRIQRRRISLKYKKSQYVSSVLLSKLTFNVVF
jgi:hypothetical protein